MYLIGLTGGIASGKSTVARRLASHGAIIVDADLVAREVVASGMPALTDIEREFGPEVILPNGELDRAALGTVIFSDPGRRKILNDIIHPRVRERSVALIERAAADNSQAIIVNDVPLLAESIGSWPLPYDLIVVVMAKAETRIDRMMHARAMTREEAVHRLDSQASDAERLAIADFIIDNDGEIEATLQQADEVWTRALSASSATATPAYGTDAVGGFA